MVECYRPPPRPPRPLPSEPFIKSSPYDTLWIVGIIGFFVGAVMLGAVLIASAIDRERQFKRESQLVRICADGTRIYKWEDGYYLWGGRERVPSPEVCR